jgi:hypothetical protein
MSHTTKWILALCLFVSGLGGGVAAASDLSGRVVVQGDHGIMDISFNDHDSYQIREYYGDRHSHLHAPPSHCKYCGLSPGLAKKGCLPPGIYKKMARHGHHSHEARYHYSPHYMERRAYR